MQILKNQIRKKMPKITGRVYSKCNRRSSAPCDGFDPKCRWISTYNAGTSLGLLALMIGLLIFAFSCSPTQFDIEPERIPGFITIDYGVQNTPIIYLAPGFKSGERYFTPVCLNDSSWNKEVTNVVVSFWQSPEAEDHYPNCK